MSTKSKPIPISNREVFNSLIDRMEDENKRELFEQFSCRIPNEARPNNAFNLYVWDGKRSTNVLLFRIVSFWIEEDGIPRCIVQREDTNETILIDTTPTLLWDREVFMFMPQNFEYAITGTLHGSMLKYAPQFKVLFQTRHRAMERVPGTHYVQAAHRPLP